MNESHEPEESLGGGAVVAAPVPRSSRLTAIAGIVLVALVGFLLAGRVQSLGGSRSPTVTPDAVRPSPTTPATPASPFGNGSASAPATGGNGLSSSEVSSVAAKVNASVVDISTKLGYGNGEAAGTGIVLTSSGEVLTNNHVIDGATQISATVVATGRAYSAHVVGTDPTDDVAVIQLDGASGLTPMRVAKSAPAVGDAVIATGNAGGRGGTPSVATGTVVALDQTITVRDDGGGDPETLHDLIQVSAPLRPGDSGGPLANRSGEVIGMDTAAEVSGRRFTPTSTAGFAIPIDAAVSIAHQIESGKASAAIHIGLPAFLGVEMAGSGGTGAVIGGVVAGTPAASLGLAGGDRITSIDGQTVDSASTLRGLIAVRRPGDRVTIGWTDTSGQHRTAVATLTTGPAD